MSLRNHWAAGCAALLLLAPVAQAADETAPSQQSMEELRNTVINLLQALVDKGFLTREQAQQLVKQAQDKAAADAAALAAKNAAQAKEEQNAVRVPYVPQIVKDEISKQVEQEVKPAVVADVVKEAKEEKWGVPAALPDWLSRVHVFGDVTFREQSDIFAKDNSSQIFDYNAINAAGGFFKAPYPFLDTTHDRNRFRLRARVGVEGDISPYLTAFIRLASGTLTTNAASESQTLGTYGERYTVGFDQAYIRWNTNTIDQLSFSTAQFGRMPNPWFAPTELVYSRDLSFEGVSDTLRLGWGEGGSDRSHVYLTLGAFPMLEVPLVNQENKWLVGGQLGTNLRFSGGADHIRLGMAYYDFLHITGRKNLPDSTQLNYTAPVFVQGGNSMFDISNSTTDPTVNLFALASHFRIADVAANYEHNFSPRYSLALTGEAVRNLGFNLTQVEALTQQALPSNENVGYVGEVSFGTPVVNRFGAWRAAVGYRYVKRDAVLDAWTDADFHEGGTNTDGYYVWTSFGLARDTWLRVRYMSSNEIDGLQRYGLDIVQIDLNARF
jgi:polyhydroxyalkanoate synthesis regulator phasin